MVCDVTAASASMAPAAGLCNISTIIPKQLTNMEIETWKTLPPGKKQAPSHITEVREHTHSYAILHHKS
jgi:hypothetical protein